MSYRVTFLPSANSFEVATGEPILKSALAAGISAPYGCRMGICRTCRARIISGRVDFGRVHESYLTEEHKAQGFAFLCQATPLSDLVIEVKELPAFTQPQKLPAIVRRYHKPAPDVAVVQLRLPINESLTFVAGQYIDVLLKDGSRRSYSIANQPAPEGVSDVQLHIRHMPGGCFTDHVFSSLIEREKFSIEAPLGTFFLRLDSNKPIVFLASGTGYAPIRSVILDAFRRQIQRPMILYWGGRARRDLYMLEEPESWARERQDFRFVPVLSEAIEADGWSGRRGLVHQAVLEDFPDLAGHQVYACGAPVMVEAARRDFVAMRGMPAEEFFADAFISRADVRVETA